jgi:integrase
MRGNAHVRFGGRAEETDMLESTHRASARPDHTHAAMLIAQGEHPRAIMERMGHSTINVTLGTYGHMFPAIDEQLDDSLGSRWERARSAPTAKITSL